MAPLSGFGVNSLMTVTEESANAPSAVAPLVSRMTFVSASIVPV